MKILFFAFTTLFAFSFLQIGHTQSLATSKGASFVGGTVSFSSNGDEFQDDRSIGFVLNPSYSYFIANRLAVGANLGLNYSRFDEDSKSSSFSIGPRISYFFDNGNTIIPYLSTAFGFGRYNFDFGFSENSGHTLSGVLSAGLAVRQDHLAILLEAGFSVAGTRSDSIPDEDYFNSNTFYLSVGLAGFLYQNE
ncbi:MAG: hypothetical protein AAF849_23395 [Bacteroidota bacterium]